MEFLGVIRAESDPPGISNERWIAMIREHPNLVPPEPRRGTNPFTKEPMTFRPPRGTGRVVVEGRDVGMMSWCESGANEVVVFGDSPLVAQLARKIAITLGGRFEPENA